MSAPPPKPTPPAAGPDYSGIDFAYAVQMLPEGECQELRRLIGAEIYDKHPKEFKEEIVRNRLANPICNYCFKKGATPLKYCQKCHCTWFCTPYCEAQDIKHQQWCCNPKSGPDMGPLRILLAKKGEGGNADWSEDQEKLYNDAVKDGRATARVPMDKVSFKPDAKHAAEAEIMYRDAHMRKIQSSEAAMLELKAKGNDRYAAKDYQGALNFYTAAIRQPIYTRPITKVRMDCWMNRSKAFAAMELWHLAYADVLALEKGMGVLLSTPKNIQTKINYLVKLKMYAEASQAYTYALETPGLLPPAEKPKWVLSKAIVDKARIEQEGKALAHVDPKIMNARAYHDKEAQERMMARFKKEVRSSYIPCHLRLFDLYSPPTPGNRAEYVKIVSAAMAPVTAVQDSSLGGLGVFALQDFKKGAAIMTEPTMFMGSAVKDRCDACAKPIKSEVLCAKKCGEHYCSTECRDEAASSYHTWQCDRDIQAGIERLRENCFREGVSMSSRAPLLMVRLLGFIGTDENVLERLYFLRQLSVGEFGNPMIIETRYKQYVRGCAAKKETPQSRDDWVRSTAPRLGLEQGFNQYSRIMNVLHLNPAWFDYYTYDYLRFALINNTFALTSDQDKQANRPGFGMAAYKAASFYNHSCVPNSRYYFSLESHGNTMFIFANRDIKKGEELTISYIDCDENYETRQEQLHQYSFECTCQKCETEKLPHLLTKLSAEEKAELLQEGIRTMERVQKGEEGNKDIVEFTKEMLQKDSK